jgi:hypothetical protein
MEERYSLTDQIRRASRSVCICLLEAYRKKRYIAHFIEKFLMPIWKTLKLQGGQTFLIIVNILTMLYLENYWRGMKKLENYSGI